jgi:hypothetical protein
MKEIWKDIPGYEKFYKVSNLGRVKSLERLNARGYKLKERILQPGINSRRYCTVVLCKNRKRSSKNVHRLVLLSFVGPSPEGMECRHLDGIRKNNNLKNLKWGTLSENQQDSIKHGTKFTPRTLGHKNPQAKLTELQVIEIRKLYKTGKWTQKKLGDKFKVSRVNIYYIINRKRWKHI